MAAIELSNWQQIQSSDEKSGPSSIGQRMENDIDPLRKASYGQDRQKFE